MVQPLLSNFDGNEQPDVVALMTEAEARVCVQRIKAHLDGARLELLRLYEGRGWAAMGYNSWMACVTAEFEQSKAYLLRQLQAGQAEQAIGLPIGNLPESHLRPLASLRDDPPALRETWTRANEIAEERGEQRTARHVAEAVAERTAPPVFVPEQPGVITPDPSFQDIADDVLVSILRENERATTSPAPMAVHFSSATPEWYTPAHVLDRVCQFFGHIDLDPCSNSDDPEQANVLARYYYTRETDGLSQSWRVPSWVDDHGEESLAVRVYMNPPYGDEIGAWVDRLVTAYESGEITEAVALLPARVDTAWCARLDSYPVCFVRGRLCGSAAPRTRPPSPRQSSISAATSTALSKPSPISALSAPPS